MFLGRRVIRPLTTSSSSTQVPISLPPEIWRMIFDYALDELVHPYQECDWLTFPSYLRNIEALTTPDVTSWKNYRLVCRTFAAILNIPIQLTIAPKNTSIPDGVKMLHVRQTLSTIDSTMRVVLSGCRSITTLTLEQILRDKGEAVSLLMDGCKALPNLRSLRLFTGLPNDFWKRLEESFPSLIELYICSSPVCDTHVTLWNLEILHLTSIEEGSLLHCPQLKHLFIKSHPGWEGFLQLHATHLESLLIRSRVSHHPDMPSYFPNLRTYGEAVPYNSTSIFDPRSDVVLAEHLCLYWSGYEPIASRSREMVKSISKMSPVRYITMDPCVMSSLEAGPLVRTCRRKEGHFSWLTPMEYPTGLTYLNELAEYYWLRYIDALPQWLINVLLTPFYCVGLMVYLPMALFGRAPIPFAGDYIYMKRG
jgi:hypothetical protein